MKYLALILLLVICAYQRVTGAPTNETLTPTEDEIHESGSQIDYLSRLMTMMGPFKDSFLGFIKGTNVTNEDLLNYRRVNTFFNKEATDVLKERFKIVRFRNGKFESINQRNVYLKYIRSTDTSTNVDYLNGIYLHNTTKFKTQWTPQIGIMVEENLIRSTDSDSSHCWIINNAHETFRQFIEHAIDGMPEANGVLIPKMFGTYVDHISITEKWRNVYAFEPPVKIFQPDVNFILMINYGAPIGVISMIHDILNNMCTLKYIKIFHISYNVHDDYRSAFEDTTSLLVFRGKGIISADFHINYTTDEHLKLKLREWKNAITFLKSHQIIAFQLRKSSTVPASSEKIFNEIFGIWPISLHSLNGGGFTECSNFKSCSSTYGMTSFILVGFRELLDLKHSLHTDEWKKQLEDTETSAKEAGYE